MHGHRAAWHGGSLAPGWSRHGLARGTWAGAGSDRIGHAALVNLGGLLAWMGNAGGEITSPVHVCPGVAGGRAPVIQMQAA